MQPFIVRIEKKIKADRQRLFRAWLEPSDFARWFIAGAQVGIGQVEMDASVGGAFRIDMIVDGVVRPHEGEFREIDEPSRLVFTWRSHATQQRETLVTITFETINPDESSGSLTLLTLVHQQLESERQASAHTGGWTSIIDHLERFAV